MSDEIHRDAARASTDVAATQHMELVARSVVAQERARIICNASEVLLAKVTETLEQNRALIREVESLTQALESRTQIALAVGMLMARENVSNEAAFAMLRRASQRTNRKIRDIAIEMLESHRQQLDSQP